MSSSMRREVKIAVSMLAASYEVINDVMTGKSKGGRYLRIGGGTFTFERLPDGRIDLGFEYSLGGTFGYYTEEDLKCSYGEDLHDLAAGIARHCLSIIQFKSPNERKEAFSELNNLISVKKLTAENFELLPCE